MSQVNNVSLNLTEAELTEINGAISILKEKLLPKLKTLTTDERVELPKMGDKTVAFVTKACEYCSQNPDLVPPFIDKNEFKIDVEAVESIRSIVNPLRQITDALNDTSLLSGSEAYQAALLFYNSVKSAGKSGIPSAEAIYNDLSARFPGRPSKSR